MGISYHYYPDWGSLVHFCLGCGLNSQPEILVPSQVPIWPLSHGQWPLDTCNPILNSHASCHILPQFCIVPHTNSCSKLLRSSCVGDPSQAMQPFIWSIQKHSRQCKSSWDPSNDPSGTNYHCWLQNPDVNYFFCLHLSQVKIWF